MRIRNLRVIMLLAQFILVLRLLEHAAVKVQGASNLTLSGKLTPSQILVSPSGVFELGFFSVSSGTSDYGFGIRYAQVSVQTVVWIPQRNNKLSSSAYFQLSSDGVLRLFDPANNTVQAVWESGNSPAVATVLELQDTGNLVLMDANSVTVWQSFDSPTDTLLPGQSLYANQSLVSWKAADDWSEGYYLCSWVTFNSTSTLLSLSWTGTSITDWNRTSWSDAVATAGNTTVYPYYTDNSNVDHIYLDTTNGNLYAVNGVQQQVLMSSTTSTSGPLRRVILERDGGLRLYSWTLGSSTSWAVEHNWASDPCHVYAECGPFAICSPDPSTPAYLGQCTCPLDSFEVVDNNNPQKGCKAKNEIPAGKCITNTSEIEISKVGDIDYPFADRLYPYVISTEQECIQRCMNNCECAGLVFWRRDGRCYIKSSPLFNGGYPQDVGNHTAYLKVWNPPSTGNHMSNVGLIAGVIAGTVFTLSALFLIMWLCWRRRRHRVGRSKSLLTDHLLGPRKFTYRELSIATKNFSDSELIGSGGMGSVYKGTLRPTDTVVAVKRVRHESRGGEEGFVAEASSISQIRHRNLVQMQGWCIEDGKLLLVYDYMCNGSLDQWLYGRAQGRSRGIVQRQSKDLSWDLRYSILTGVAAALAYLHEEWQQCVLHRDIKSSNVMLDDEFNAHLGDFGLARLIDHQKVEKTTMMAGTLGYMAPEMPYTGKATKETDVYSFGILMLEVVCGKQPVDSGDHELDPEDVVLLHRVWRAYEGGKLLSVVDQRLEMAARTPSSEKSSRIASEPFQKRRNFTSNSNQDDSPQISENPSRSKQEDVEADYTGALSRRIEEEILRENDQKTVVLKLGLLCCLPNPSARPSIRLVHQILTGDVTTLPPLPATNQFASFDVLTAVRVGIQPHPSVSERSNSSEMSTESSLDQTVELR